MPEDQWRVTIPDHHPGYITQEQFVINRQRLEANRTNTEVLAGPAREGLCLLQGLLLCAKCGRRLGVWAHRVMVCAILAMAASIPCISAPGSAEKRWRHMRA